MKHFTFFAKLYVGMLGAAATLIVFLQFSAGGKLVTSKIRPGEYLLAAVILGFVVAGFVLLNHLMDQEQARKR